MRRVGGPRAPNSLPRARERRKASRSLAHQDILGPGGPRGITRTQAADTSSTHYSLSLSLYCSLESAEPRTPLHTDKAVSLSQRTRPYTDTKLQASPRSATTVHTAQRHRPQRESPSFPYTCRERPRVCPSQLLRRQRLPYRSATGSARPHSPWLRPRRLSASFRPRPPARRRLC